MMNKALRTAEPEVEDLLASIRKAITHEAGLAPREPGPERPARPRPGPGAEDARTGEILDLRNKISSQLGRKDADRPSLARPAAVSPNGFAGILGGERPMPAKPTAAASRLAEPEALPLRESLARAELPEAEPSSYTNASYQSSSYRDELPRHRTEPVRSWEEPEVPRYPLLSDSRASRSGGQHDPGMLSQDSAAAASTAFSRLAETLMARATGERSIEEITRELLRTMLKQWLDDHLPTLVERLVREEIERVARRGPSR